jgi:hypothetical protein
VLRRVLIFVAPNHRSDDAAQIEILVLRHQLGPSLPTSGETPSSQE